MRKLFAVVLALALALSCCTAFAERLDSIPTTPHIEDGQYPVEGDKSLSWWMAINKSAVSFISSYDENPAYQQVQTDTGIDIRFIHPTVGMEKEQFQLMIVSGELPDIIMLSDSNWYEGGLPQMHEDGLIIDLTPYLENYAPQYKWIIDNNADIQKAVCQGDDSDQVFGFWRCTLGDAIPFTRCIARADWLEEFGMEPPTTIEEYEAYFEAVLANKPGVVPFYMSLTSADQQVLMMGAFDMCCNYFVVDGQVHHYANEPAYKDYLALMNRWYEKGYMSKDFASLTENEVLALFDGGQLAMYTGNVDQAYNRTIDLADVKQIPLPYMRKNADSVLHTDISNAPVSTGLACVSVITTACEDVEAALALLNYGYTWEGSVVYNWGTEGLTFEWGEDGMPHYTEFVSNNPDGKTTGNISYTNRIHLGSKVTWSDAVCGPGMTSKPDYAANRLLWSDDPNVDNNYRLPSLQLTADESERRNEIMAEVNTYISEMKFKFITGDESLDHFDAYIEHVNAIGLMEAVEITQAAYDRYMAQ